jgi:hypothetical protein
MQYVCTVLGRQCTTFYATITPADHFYILLLGCKIILLNKQQNFPLVTAWNFAWQQIAFFSRNAQMHLRRMKQNAPHRCTPPEGCTLITWFLVQALVLQYMGGIPYNVALSRQFQS